MQNNLELADLGLYLKEENTLVIADLHIGYEEALNAQGMLLPRIYSGRLMTRLSVLLEKKQPSHVVIAGDLKHEYGTISEQEWRETLKVIDLISSKAKITLVKGNHDTILGPIARKRGLEIVEHKQVGNSFICHGHLPLQTLPEDTTNIIIGHEHPALTLSHLGRAETYKCFLLGAFEGKRLIVLPSLNLVTEGTDVLGPERLSPLLADISRFKVIAVGDKHYDFGTVGELRSRRD